MKDELSASERIKVLKGLEDMYLLATEDFACVKAVHKEYMRVPIVKSVSISLKAVSRCQVLQPCVVLWAACTLSLEVSTKGLSRKRLRDFNAVSNDEGLPWPELPPPPPAFVVITCFIESMHLVQNMDSKDDYVFQSSLAVGNPTQLQCYPRNMLQFAFSMYDALRRGSVEWDALGPIVVLGMGANILASAISRAQLRTVPIHVVEIEPTVVDVCREQGQLVPGDNFHVHVGAAAEILPTLPNKCSMIFVDCYDVATRSMVYAEELLKRCCDQLATDGMIIVNAHLSLSAQDLRPFVHQFAAVHAFNVPGLRQCIVIGLKQYKDSVLSISVPSLRQACKRLAVHPQIGTVMSNWDAVCVLESRSLRIVKCPDVVSEEDQLSEATVRIWTAAD